VKALKYKLRKWLISIGIDVYPYDHRNSVQSFLEYLIKHREIKEVWDVGANVGQYAKMLRMLGFKQKIISFEALPDAYEILKDNAEADVNWTTHGPLVISEQRQKIEFFETDNSVSSSRLKPLSMDIVKHHVLPSKPLEDFLNNADSKTCRLLKLDVQGSEQSVLASCGSQLQKFDYVQLEASIRTSYENEIDYISIIRYMNERNYKLMFVYPGVADVNGNVIQVELFFSKNEI